MMRRLMIAAAVVHVGVLAAVLVRPATASQERPLDPMVIAWDKGPDTVDVSKYSVEMKKKFKVFETICSRCHTLARAVNCDFALEDEWERYIKRMMRRGRGLITPDVAQEAFEFAVYDSKLRKRDLYEKKLATSRQQQDLLAQ